MKVEEAIKVPCPEMTDSQGVVFCTADKCPIWRTHEWVSFKDLNEGVEIPQGYKKASGDLLFDHDRRIIKGYDKFFKVFCKDEGECGLITLGCENNL